MIAAALTLSAAALAAASSPVPAPAAPPRFIYSPYKHLAMWKDASNALIVAPYGKPLPFLSMEPRPEALTWAFATGECGEERWGEQSAAEVAEANVASFDRAGVDYIVSTGGQGGVFTCATDEGMERFIARYESPRLIGIDFDIEAGQTPAQVDSLVQRIKAAQLKRPHLRYSFTVATHAASDGSRKSLNHEGENILRTLRRHGVKDFTFNLMVMDYGPGKKSNCVLRGAVCDMGQSAIQAARNVHARYKIPYAQIELTAMIGVNDVVSNVFTLTDARVLADTVRSMGMAGLHYWSLDRDTPCSEPTKGASSTCSTLKVRSGAYHEALRRSLD